MRDEGCGATRVFSSALIPQPSSLTLIPHPSSLIPSVNDAPLRILALEPIAIELDQFQLTLELDNVGPCRGGEIDQQIPIDRLGPAAPFDQLLLHRPLAVDEDLCLLTERE